jgi:hypothetical protein
LFSIFLVFFHKCLYRNGNVSEHVIAGYGNEEEVPLKKLQPSEGQAAQQLQEAAAQDMDKQPVSPLSLILSSVREGSCHM